MKVYVSPPLAPLLSWTFIRERLLHEPDIITSASSKLEELLVVMVVLLPSPENVYQTPYFETPLEAGADEFGDPTVVPLILEEPNVVALEQEEFAGPAEEVVKERCVP